MDTEGGDGASALTGGDVLVESVLLRSAAACGECKKELKKALLRIGR